MTYHFRPAVRTSTRLFIGLAGPSGAGKTLSALRLATGLAQGGKIVFGDTEKTRARQYAPQEGQPASPPMSFDFLHATIEAPFAPATYRTFIDEALKQKPTVLIIDSLSHEWEGPGGILEMVEQSRRGLDDKNAFMAWARPKQEHQKLVNLLLQADCHVIVCMRAKEKHALRPDPDKPGKMKVTDIGWQPIAEGSLAYEMALSFLLGVDGHKKGSPVLASYDYTKLPINMQDMFTDGEQIDEALGERLAAWISGGAAQRAEPAKPAAEPTSEPPQNAPQKPSEPRTEAFETHSTTEAPQRVVYTTPGGEQVVCDSWGAWVEKMQTAIGEAQEPIAIDAILDFNKTAGEEMPDTYRQALKSHVGIRRQELKEMGR